MKKATQFFSLALMLLFVGCSTTKDLPNKTLFAFDYEGEHYEILGINEEGGKGTNILIKRIDGKAIYTSRDFEQDGTLDKLHLGDMSLAQANEVYQYGLAKAFLKGKIKSQMPQRIYEITFGDALYTVQTVGLADEDMFNQFIVVDLQNGNEQRFYDTDADGELDKAQNTAMTLVAAQGYYDKVLKEGIKNNKIMMQNDMYVVQINEPGYSASLK